MSFWKSICGAIALAVTVSIQPVHADSWALPKPKTYESPDKNARFRVTPVELSSQYAYFKEQTEPGDALKREKPLARGILERRNAQASWDTVWDRALVNEISPVDALVAPDGRYVVTFDDWHFVGTSENTVVIYAADGRLIKVLSLPDIVPEFYITALSRTVSSVGWSYGARFSDDGEDLIVQLAPPRDLETDTEMETETDRAPVDQRIRLSDGKVLENTSAAWAEAQAQAITVNAADALARQKEREAFIAPLYGPTSGRALDWHEYLSEAFFRVDENWQDNYPATHVLSAPDAENYERAKQALRERLLQTKHKIDILAIASLSSPEHFVTVLESIMGDARRNSLKGVRIYLAIPTSYRDKLLAIFSASGATVVVLDPTQPIPQRTDRLRAMEEAEREVGQ